MSASSLAGSIAKPIKMINDLRKTIPRYQWATVANVSPATVIMDTDPTATPWPVSDVLVPGLAVGQRVEVRVIGSRRVITSIHPADNGLYVAHAVVLYGGEGSIPEASTTTVDGYTQSKVSGTALSYSGGGVIDVNVSGWYAVSGAVRMGGGDGARQLRIRFTGDMGGNVFAYTANRPTGQVVSAAATYIEAGGSIELQIYQSVADPLGYSSFGGGETNLRAHLIGVDA